jgi:anti-sigma factor RsiW
MSEQIQEHVSAFTDDELSAEQCQFLVRRLERDKESRAKALRYAMIGAAMRGELLAPEPDVLRRRLHQELAGITPPAPQSAARRNRMHRWLRPALGAGIAASVAAISLLALNGISRVAPQADGLLIAGQGLSGGEIQADAPSYVVPREVTGSFAPADPAVAPSVLLTNYLVQHGEYASGIGRTSIHSNVINTQGAWVVSRRTLAE